MEGETTADGEVAEARYVQALGEGERDNCRRETKEIEGGVYMRWCVGTYCFFGFHVKVVEWDNVLLLPHPVGHNTECLLETIVVSGLHHG